MMIIIDQEADDWDVAADTPRESLLA